LTRFLTSARSRGAATSTVPSRDAPSTMLKRAALGASMARPSAHDRWRLPGAARPGGGIGSSSSLTTGGRTSISRARTCTSGP
jgi:hypothetical protein